MTATSAPRNGHRPPSPATDVPIWRARLESLFRDEPLRLAHIDGVWRRARGFARRRPAGWSDADLAALELAALLHDIGRGLDPADARPHALVGAEHLRAAGLARVALIVAHHSGGALEAELRGMGAAYGPWPRDPGDVTAALTYLDGTTGPRGERVTRQERLLEVQRRHGRESVRARVLAMIGDEVERGRTLVDTRRRLPAGRGRRAE